MSEASKSGVLLVNLGTPEAPTTPAVRRYLREFLSDPRVIDIGPVGRWMLVNLIIAPFRSPKSAEAYAKIWTDAGSPLLVHSKALLERVRARLPEIPVELAMRYGTPSIATGLRELHESGVERVTVLPLYPQYADSTSGSSAQKVKEEAARLWARPLLRTIEPFYEHPAFIEAFAEVGSPVLAPFEPDHVLFSFHGLPERHVRATDPSGRHCLARPDCCDAISPPNRHCYRAHCFATGRALAARLDLGDDAWSVSFQSRLGRQEWIKPYTTQTIEKLAARGVKRLAVFCPAFVADCLETLEEIGLRAAADFEAAGGEQLRLVPSLNAEPAWVDAVVGMITEAEQPLPS